MKQFVKALPKDGQCPMLQIFLSEAKLVGVFVGPYIRRMMMFDPQFELHIKLNEKQAWIAFKEVVRKFLGNKKDPDCKAIVGKC